MLQYNIENNHHAVIQTHQLCQSLQLHSKMIQVLKNINLNIKTGEQIAIIGRSGSGKSTLLGLLAGLDTPSSGEIYLCGQPLHALNEEQRAKIRLASIGFIFQSFQLLPHLTALENVLLPLQLQKQMNSNKAKQQAQMMLEKVGLVQRMQHRAKVLSGGEQQRVAIARALVTMPQVIFADEPTGNLDHDTAQEIEKLLFNLNQEQKTTLILVTHDQTLAARCQRKIYLDNGQLLSNT